MSSPYQPEDRQTPKSQKSSAWWIVGVIGGIGMLLVLVCCGGGFGIVAMGFKVIEADLENQLRDNPQIRQHIGEIEEFTTNYAKSFATEDEEEFVYDVKGSKGSAELTIKSKDDGATNVLESVVMRLPTGEEIDVEIDSDDSP